MQAQEYHATTHRAHQPSGAAPAASGHAQRAPAASGHAERQRARDEQLKLAMEATPEAFCKVPMLYVRCTLNDVPLKAFVDTGAQMTVMSLETAQKCKLACMRLQGSLGLEAKLE